MRRLAHLGVLAFALMVVFVWSSRTGLGAGGGDCWEIRPLMCGPWQPLDCNGVPPPCGWGQSVDGVDACWQVHVGFSDCGNPPGGNKQSCHAWWDCKVDPENPDNCVVNVATVTAQMQWVQVTNDTPCDDRV